jgi:hypothetical protein
VDIQPVDIQPVDIQPVDIQPVDIQPVDIQPELTMAYVKEVLAKIAVNPAKRAPLKALIGKCDGATNLSEVDPSHYAKLLEGAKNL